MVLEDKITTPVPLYAPHISHEPEHCLESQNSMRESIDFYQPGKWNERMTLPAIGSFVQVNNPWVLWELFRTYKCCSAKGLWHKAGKHILTLGSAQPPFWQGHWNSEHIKYTIKVQMRLLWRIVFGLDVANIHMRS